MIIETFCALAVPVIKIFDVITTDKALADNGKFHEVNPITSSLQKYLGKYWWLADIPIAVVPQGFLYAEYLHYPDVWQITAGLVVSTLIQLYVVGSNIRLVGV